MIGTSRKRIRVSSSAVEILLGLIVTALLASLSKGRDPPPICDSQSSIPNSASKSNPFNEEANSS